MGGPLAGHRGFVVDGLGGRGEEEVKRGGRGVVTKRSSDEEEGEKEGAGGQ